MIFALSQLPYIWSLFLQDDDSDIECEREAIPHVTNETKLEADACVKVNNY